MSSDLHIVPKTGLANTVKVGIFYLIAWNESNEYTFVYLLHLFTRAVTLLLFTIDFSR